MAPKVGSVFSLCMNDSAIVKKSVFYHTITVQVANVIFRDVKLEFFSKSKLESKKSIKTRNSFPVVS